MRELFEHQEKFIDEVTALPEPARACLYFRTGSGKSLAAMLGMKALGMEDVLVIAPPSTHKSWTALADSLGMDVLCMSHAKFRMPGTKVDRLMPVIADEFHMFGGQKGQGWKKLDRLARGLQAPLFLLSATPNYNDAERCYCVQHILSPEDTKGGYLQFLYENCTTEQNPFGLEPKVTGFKHYPDAAAFLADLQRVYYLEDDLEYEIVDLPYKEHLPDELFDLKYDRRKHRMVASDIEMRHTVRYQGLVQQDGSLRPHVREMLLDLIDEHGTVLVYADHATVARAASMSLGGGMRPHRLVTGHTSKREKELYIQEFNKVGGVLIGTASLATGTDGMDKVCDTLVILDDTDDDALRRQLVGRIMPRGPASSAAGKKVLRFVPS